MWRAWEKVASDKDDQGAAHFCDGDRLTHVSRRPRQDDEHVRLADDLHGGGADPLHDGDPAQVEKRRTKHVENQYRHQQCVRTDLLVRGPHDNPPSCRHPVAQGAGRCGQARRVEGRQSEEDQRCGRGLEEQQLQRRQHWVVCPSRRPCATAPADGALDGHILQRAEEHGDQGERDARPRLLEGVGGRCLDTAADRQNAAGNHEGHCHPRLRAKRLAEHGRDEDGDGRRHAAEHGVEARVNEAQGHVVRYGRERMREHDRRHPPTKEADEAKAAESHAGDGDRRIRRVVGRSDKKRR
mmetsp:Transcript_108195/g.312692  ORF Transcript_108195/g.312692 Transcript_108195/m.312692 type:complete len:297 (+) Transcript_108195:136-1026(+)